MEFSLNLACLHFKKLLILLLVSWAINFYTRSHAHTQFILYAYAQIVIHLTKCLFYVKHEQIWYIYEAGFSVQYITCCGEMVSTIKFSDIIIWYTKNISSLSVWTCIAKMHYLSERWWWYILGICKISSYLTSWQTSSR